MGASRRGNSGSTILPICGKPAKILKKWVNDC
jgi:hypothetical protein